MIEGRAGGIRGPVAAGLAAIGLVAVIVASAVATRYLPAGKAGATPSPTPDTSSAGAAPSAKPPIRWFVGLDGTSAAQLAAAKAFVARYNAGNKDGVTIEIDDPHAVDPAADPYDVIRTQLSGGNGTAPDIVGPATLDALDGLDGLWTDLTSEIAKKHLDLGAYDPSLVKLVREPDVAGAALTGIPWVIDPGFIAYNEDLLSKAGLPPLPTAVGQTYQGQTWDWNELAETAARLTVDTSGRNSTQAGFDPANVAQFGFDFPTSDARVMASTFGSGSFLAGYCPSVLQIAPNWSDAFNWYYRAIWTKHIAPTLPQQRALGQAGSVASGRVAMALSFSSEIGSYGGVGGASSAGWGMAVIPSWKGSTTSPVTTGRSRS